MKRTVQITCSVIALCSSLQISCADKKNALKTFMYAMLISAPVGAYQEFSRSHFQGGAITSLGISALIFPSLASFNRAGKHPSDPDTIADRILTQTTAGAWGGAVGYFVGLMSGSLVRLHVGRDTLASSRAVAFVWRMSESFFYGAGESLGENIARQMRLRVFG